MYMFFSLYVIIVLWCVTYQFMCAVQCATEQLLLFDAGLAS